MAVTFQNEKSVRKRIIEHVVTTLQGITEANGYHVDMASVQRYDSKGFRSKAMPACIVQGGEQSTHDGATPMVSKSFTVWVQALMRRDEDDPQSVDDALEDIVCDIETALMQDHTRGGLAVTTETDEVAPMDYLDKSGVVFPGMVIGFKITYRHHYQDPTWDM